VLAHSLVGSDKVVPHFITHALRPGLAGIVIAGIFAATMSSLSAGFNSLSTATIIDFYKRINPGISDTDAHSVKAAKWCTLFWAAFGTIAAMNVNMLGTIPEIMGKINGFIAGPLIAIFLLGVLTKRTNTIGALSGAIIGTVVTAIAAKYKLSWVWFGPVGCVTTMLVGYVISFLGKAPAAEDINGLTLATYKSKDESDALEAKNATERLVPADEPEA
jgi:Na+/proline symporter